MTSLHLNNTRLRYSFLFPISYSQVSGASMEEWTRGPTIGRGSTATVSIAVASSGRIFAVKTVELSSSAILQREQSLLSELSSPHVVKFIGSVSTRENNIFLYNILMEYVGGGTLHDLIKKRGGKLPEPEIRSFTRQILKGLSYLHSRGIVHCDVKSQNVLIGENGVVAKISDLGCAKTVENGGVTSEFSGTPAFMAPEVARGEEQGFAADVWALGCTVIEMATGSSPWPGLNDVVAAMYKIGFSGESPEIPGWLSEKAKDFLRNCLRREASERWAVHEFLQHPFLDEQDESRTCLNTRMTTSSSSPSTVLDQYFWDSFELSKSLLIQTEHEDPFPDPSSYRDSPADRIKKLAGDGFSGVPDWDTDDWIQLRNNEIGPTQKRNDEENEIGVEETPSEATESVESWNSDQDSMSSDHFSDSDSSSNYYYSTIGGDVIPSVCYNVECNSVSSDINCVKDNKKYCFSPIFESKKN
ncbi:PREDICTED: mitogen-activated protein kinase kinase kinase 2-like [Tarenaya hassleriana]|uniref:mitogen-activated protein kinase kinase kinase 2-like n=1 Tax=Tarenaya hassleriana TaxID=28532 RepID=UPI00053C5875|nr:PREDICTED: mitogen-activated protein kinase kinase kinase 2-like [Tarenaya hassleriana]